MSLTTWASRRAMGRLGITDDIVRHLTTLQRQGGTVDAAAPGERLPVGSRTALRALRTHAATQLGSDWVWPYWLERQLDPRSPSFTPRGDLPVLTNVTHRNWTMVGNVGSRREAIVDPRGLVTPWFGGWSLDWWVGADDRWHLPSQSTAVRQRLVDSTPVVETAMRVPGGDAVQRVYAVPDGDELIVVEIENDSAVPFVVALAVRPYNPEGLAVIERIRLHDKVLTVDGRPALLFPKPPAAWSFSSFQAGDSAIEVMQGRAGRDGTEVRCEAGLAQAAFLFPVAHRTTLRVALPLAPPRRTRGRGSIPRRVGSVPEVGSHLPTATEVARGWLAQTRRGMQLDLPSGRLADAVEANRRFQLLFHDGDEITLGAMRRHRFRFRDAGYQLAALDRYGFHREAKEVLRSYPDRQQADGFIASRRQQWDTDDSAIVALAEHWRLTRDDELVRELAASVWRGVSRIERKRGEGRRRGDGSALRRPFPAGVSGEPLGPVDHSYGDDFWRLRGLIDGATLLRVAGRDEEAGRAERGAATFLADIEASLRSVADRLGSDAIPAGPGRNLDSGVIGSLVACWPLRLLPHDAPAMAATSELLRQRFCPALPGGDGAQPAFYEAVNHTGFGTYFTLQLAFVELDSGDRRALERLEWFLDVAMPTWTWPEAVHPDQLGGCMGDGHHGRAAADFLSFVRQLLVREISSEHQPGLALCSMLPSAWVGQPLAVREAPTHHGLLSFAVRWHGPRPALLWDFRPHAGIGPVKLSAPGLDPNWSTTETSGEALLGSAALATQP